MTKLPAAIRLTDRSGGGAGTRLLAAVLLLAVLWVGNVLFGAKVSILLFGPPPMCAAFAGIPPDGVSTCLAEVPEYGHNTLFGPFCPNMLGSEDPRQPPWRWTGDWVGDNPVCVR